MGHSWSSTRLNQYINLPSGIRQVWQNLGFKQLWAAVRKVAAATSCNDGSDDTGCQADASKGIERERERGHLFFFPFFLCAEKKMQRRRRRRRRRKALFVCLLLQRGGQSRWRPPIAQAFVFCCCCVLMLVWLVGLSSPGQRFQWLDGPELDSRQLCV